MKLNITELERLALTIRMLSADAVEEANSGHPGMPMGAADYAAVLWSHFLRFNPEEPEWINRDRFVLSAGHGSMLLYSLLHLFGFDLPLSEIKSFRQWGSKTPGHPEFGMTAGVEATTGPLGQGFGNGVGMALSGKLLAETYSKDLFDYRVFGIVSDGDLMEGISAEAASLAGHLGLGNLIYIYDDNEISIGGSTEVCFTENSVKRFEAQNWHVQSVDGHDLEAVAACLRKAIDEKDRPSIICAKTTIGWGSPHKAGSADVHGAPLGKEELRATKEALNWPLEPRFHIPAEAGAYCCERMGAITESHTEWKEKFTAWSRENPEKANLLSAQLSREVPADLKKALISEFQNSSKDATRNLSGKVIQVIAKHVPWLVGGSADLEPSTKTLIKDSSDIQKDNFTGRNIRFGVREHAMGAIVNGLAYSKCWLPYSATFLVFSDYMRPSIRLAALSHIQSFFIFTHDSFWVGEDGPTHQPVEHVASLRLIPGLYNFRPADGLETAMCYLAALEKKNSPSTFLLTRQGLPPIERPESFDPDDIQKGAYIAYGAENNDLLMVATGSEVSVAIEAARLLEDSGKKARVVSMPCVELFCEQSDSYKKQILPENISIVSIEAGTTIGWSEIVGFDALKIGLNHFGASAPGETVAEKFKFSAKSVCETILSS